MYTKTPKT